jgi:type I restriction enzyme S subunit
VSWREITLGDSFTIKHGFAFKGQYFGDSGEHIVLTPGNFYESGGFRARPGKDRYYSVEPPEDFILRGGDLVIAMTEQGEGLLGSSAIIPREGSYLHNQRIGLIENLDESKFDRSYLCRLFNTPQVRTHIRATASGTKVRHTAPKRIYSIKVKVPPVTTQRRISETLSAYDDLIKNNRQRIALLEEAARIFYREWFVRFRFPGHEHVKIIDGIPVDWKVRPIAKVCTTYDDGDWLETKDQGGVDYRIIQISNIGDNCFTETGNGRYITEGTVRRLIVTRCCRETFLSRACRDPLGVAGWSWRCHSEWSQR